ncbi:ribonuclease H-like domain-containing protein, partial [Tanacetum coccineum]
MAHLWLRDCPPHNFINYLNWNCPAFYEDDDEEYTVAITPEFPITDSLSIGDEHLSTILEIESDQLIKSSVENLVPTPSEFEDLSKDLYDIESECDVPVCDKFTTFSNPLFDNDDDFSSSDDESFSDEDVSKEIYLNPLFDEEIISTKIDPHHFNSETGLIESLLNRDTSINSSPKFNSLLEEFSGELAHIDLISPGINETDFDPEEEIRLVEKLLYDKLSPRPPEEFNSENSDVEELDSAYERFQNILSMLELYDAKVSLEDANLKFLRSLPSVWHVVATMIRGQPGLDELEFDDLYNNLKVYEHELKGVSNSNSQNIAFLSTEVKGSTLKQSTVEPAHIPKGYNQAASSKVQTAPNCASHSDEIICSFFAQQASMPTTHDDEDLLQIDEDAMEEIDIRWQVAMITARIRKFMRKTGRPIDLKPKNGITFDKSKIECFNCQKLGHFARECRFAKYQENRANGRQEKRIVAIEDPNSKALVATDNNEDIDWTKEFDAEPVTFAMMALTEFEEDDWSMEIDAEPMHFGQDGLGDFDWSNTADDTPVSLALMATNSEVPYCSKCSKSYKKLLENYQTERDNFQKARSEILGYQMSLESLEVILKTHEKNEYAWGDKYEQMEYDLK